MTFQIKPIKFKQSQEVPSSEKRSGLEKIKDLLMKWEILKPTKLKQNLKYQLE